MKKLRYGLLAIVLVAAGCATANEPTGGPAATVVDTRQSAESTSVGNWLQPSGHTPETLAAAYADDQLDSRDSVYFVGDRIVSAWQGAKRRSGSAGRDHGYREGFADMELVVIENNDHVQTAALGKLPSQYLKALKPEIFKAIQGKRSRVTLAQCDEAHIRFSEAGWMPPGFYPLRDADGEHRGAVEMIVHKRFPQAVVPLFDGVTSVVVPVEPLMHQDQPGADPTVSWGIIEDGQEVPLQFLPSGNTTNRVVSTPENKGRKNALRVAADLGANLWIAIVPPGACKPNAGV